MCEHAPQSRSAWRLRCLCFCNVNPPCNPYTLVCGHHEDSSPNMQLCPPVGHFLPFLWFKWSQVMFWPLSHEQKWQMLEHLLLICDFVHIFFPLTQDWRHLRWWCFLYPWFPRDFVEQFPLLLSHLIHDGHVIWVRGKRLSFLSPWDIGVICYRSITWLILTDTVGHIHNVLR